MMSAIGRINESERGTMIWRTFIRLVVLAMFWGPVLIGGFRYRFDTAFLHTLRLPGGIALCGLGLFWFWRVCYWDAEQILVSTTGVLRPDMPMPTPGPRLFIDDPFRYVCDQTYWFRPVEIPPDGHSTYPARVGGSPPAPAAAEADGDAAGFPTMTKEPKAVQ